MGKAVRLAVQLCVAQRLLANPGSDCFRLTCGLSFDQAMNGLTLRETHRAGVKALEQVLTFLRTHQRNITQHRVFIIHQCMQQLFEIAVISLHRGLIEQRGCVFQRAKQRIALLAEVQRQIKLADLTLLLDHAQRQTVHVR